MRLIGLVLAFILCSSSVQAFDPNTFVDYLNSARILSGLKQKLKLDVALINTAFDHCQFLAKNFDTLGAINDKNVIEFSKNQLFLIRYSHKRKIEDIGLYALLKGYGTDQVEERVILDGPYPETAVNVLLSSPYEREPFLNAGIYDFGASACQVRSKNPEYDGQWLYVLLIGNYRAVLQNKLLHQLCDQPGTDTCPLGPGRCRTAIKCSSKKLIWQEWLSLYERKVYQPQNEGMVVFPGSASIYIYPVANNLEYNRETARPWGSPISLHILPDTFNNVSLALPADFWFDDQGQLKQNWPGGYIRGVPVMSPDVFLYNEQDQLIELIPYYGKNYNRPTGLFSWLPAMPLEWGHTYRLEVHYQQADSHWVVSSYYFSTMPAGTGVIEVEEGEQTIKVAKGEMVTLVFPFNNFPPDEVSRLVLTGYPGKNNAHVDYSDSLYIKPDNRVLLQVDDDYMLFNEWGTFRVYILAE